MILVYLEHEGDELTKGALTAIAAALEGKARHGYDKAAGLLIGEKDPAAAADKAESRGKFIKGPVKRRLHRNAKLTAREEPF